MSAPYSLATGQVLIIFLQVLSLETQNELPDYDPSWEIQLMPTPTQFNEVDCGFFAIMVAVHLIYFHRLNPENVPDPLKLESTNMLTTRLVLAGTLIHWCTNPILGADGPVQNSRELLDNPYADLESQERILDVPEMSAQCQPVMPDKKNSHPTKNPWSPCCDRRVFPQVRRSYLPPLIQTSHSSVAAELTALDKTRAMDYKL
ncbi:hypothetical protein C8J57DRAFT_1227997 [Mycena rebaudengoi]|nr:hypothetical protein C8J57DRAFT_1227997 [Mycena rebaudengoi]